MIQFPEKYRKDFAKRHTKLGSVIKCLVDDTDIPKEKRFVIIGISEDKAIAATLYFNTEERRNPRINQYQVHYNKQGRDYLDWGSYLDCSDIHEKNVKLLEEELTRNPKSHIGTMNQRDLDLACDKVANASTITPKLKKKFGLQKYIREGN